MKLAEQPVEQRKKNQSDIMKIMKLKINRPLSAPIRLLAASPVLLTAETIPLSAAINPGTPWPATDARFNFRFSTAEKITDQK